MQHPCQLTISLSLNAPSFPSLQGIDQCDSPSSISPGATILGGSFKDRLKKRKYIRKRVGLLFKNNLPTEISDQHVFNFLGIVSLNQRTLKDASYEESYYRSMFYTRSVEKVEVRKQALLVFTRSIDTPTPIPYLTQRLRSHGSSTLRQLAQSIQTSNNLFESLDLRKQLAKCGQSQPLARFIEGMGDRIYMCKVAPNRLLISRTLLEFLGEDPEMYAIRICKHRTPIDEYFFCRLRIIPGYHYAAVIEKSVQSIGLLCNFLKGKLSLQQLQDQTSIEFNDYLLARERRIYCRFKVFMPNPLISCFQIKEKLSQVEQWKQYNGLDTKMRSCMQKQMIAQNYNEAQVLSKLISLPPSLDPAHRHRIAGYLQRHID